VSSAVLHLTNDEWRLNHIAMGRSLGQVSLVQVTASSRWTPTIPEHSNSDVVRMLPLENQLLQCTGSAVPERYEPPERLNN
jgi:hypothetical protein